MEIIVGWRGKGGPENEVDSSQHFMEYGRLDAILGSYSIPVQESSFPPIAFPKIPAQASGQIFEDDVNGFFPPRIFAS